MFEILFCKILSVKMKEMIEKFRRTPKPPQVNSFFLFEIKDGNKFVVSVDFASLARIFRWLLGRVTGPRGLNLNVLLL